ncbi:MAG: carboxypeptidase-like regulatory domain-containing protein [Capnocytophaga sp.]|nr:carboxypeptidase-like regulatory domain-containing protein [Capnocytophaga sp.]
MKFKKYIAGKRHGKTANRLERKAMDDPFLQDAIDGYDAVEDNHSEAIKHLEKQIVTIKKKRSLRYWWWAAAAVLLLGTGISFWQSPKPEELPVVVSPSEDKMLPKKDSLWKPVEIIPDEKPTDEAVVTVPTKTEIEKSIGEPSGITSEKSNTAVDVFKKNTVQKETSKIASIAGEKIIAGQLTDEQGVPLSGATVSLKGTNSSTTTDFDGHFAITVPDENSTLEFSYLGFEKQEIFAKDSLGQIAMKEDLQQLSEVVVTGFGTHRKAAVVGAINPLKEIFGESEFKKYLKENIDTEACNGQKITLKLSFYINTKGQIRRAEILESNCKNIDRQVKKLMRKSPIWSATEQFIILEIEL